MYDHAYKISKFEKFDLFARTIIRAVLKFGSKNFNISKTKISIF